MEFVLVGQPNCGKSTIFNYVVGFKSETSNFPGTTVNYTQGYIDLDGEKITVTDLPGTYSLQMSESDELDAVSYLLDLKEDNVIINILDASVLSRSLELTLQLMELQRPMVVVLNMADEAANKAITIDSEKLSKKLGIPVVQTIGNKGKGVSEIFSIANQTWRDNRIPNILEAPEIVEDTLSSIIQVLEKREIHSLVNPRFAAMKLLEKDDLIKEILEKGLNSKDWKEIEERVTFFEKKQKNSSEFIISSYRHNLAFQLFEEVAVVGVPPRKDIRNTIDSLLMHPILGYFFLAGILYLTFWAIFSFAEVIEPVLSGFFESLTGLASARFGEESLVYSLFKGFLDGFGGGINIAIPYLLPFFIILSFLEDTGYLARIAYLIDNIMHRIGLHGLSVVPLVLGFGCTVPSIMATRIMNSRRDRFITATLATLVPCSARMIIIFGLVAFLFSLQAALIIYLVDLVVLALTGKILSRIMPEVSPGLIMEIPRYHVPSPRVVMTKTWYKMKEFIVIAWPLLVAGSIVLELINHYNWTGSINRTIKPFTSGLLGLPPEVGVVLIFGILRKELALVLLASAFGLYGTREILTVMDPAQVYSFTLFATFYIPCLATFAALLREFRLSGALIISGITFSIAIILAVGARLTVPLFM